MTWARARLEQVAGDRLAKRSSVRWVDRAALAYARWQGLTDEVGLDTEAARRTLDKALTELDKEGPEGWHGLERLGTELGDAAIIGLMQYSLERNTEQIKDQPEAAEPESSERGGDKPANSPRKHGRSRDR
jgi:hypothetical protein